MRKKVNTHFENSLNGFHSIRAFLEYSSAANDVLNTRAGKPLLSTHLRGKKSTEIKGFRRRSMGWQNDLSNTCRNGLLCGAAGRWAGVSGWSGGVRLRKKGTPRCKREGPACDAERFGVFRPSPERGGHSGGAPAAAVPHGDGGEKTAVS